MNPVVIAGSVPHISSPRPISPGPQHSNVIRQQVLRHQNSHRRSTPLKMVAISVNRTALHPGGVQ
jgi:phosphoenolpyruvate carboxykinase (ATP)